LKGVETLVGEVLMQRNILLAASSAERRNGEKAWENLAALIAIGLEW
jgi:hypothetical protein